MATWSVYPETRKIKSSQFCQWMKKTAGQQNSLDYRSFFIRVGGSRALKATFESSEKIWKLPPPQYWGFRGLWGFLGSLGGFCEYLRISDTC